jgi:hypothetical protein
VEFVTLEWVDWFNHRRLLEPIGNMPPAEAEERYYAMLDEPAMAAQRQPNGLRKTRRGSNRYNSYMHAGFSWTRVITSKMTCPLVIPPQNNGLQK